MRTSARAHTKNRSFERVADYPIERPKLTARLSKPFTLKVGQAAIVPSEKLDLTFQEVLEDSRCPSDAIAVWAGRVRLTMIVKQPGRRPAKLELNTSPKPTVGKQVAHYGDLTLQLLSVAPAQGKAEQEILPFDYEATLIVTKA